MHCRPDAAHHAVHWLRVQARARVSCRVRGSIVVIVAVAAVAAITTAMIIIPVGVGRLNTRCLPASPSSSACACDVGVKRVPLRWRATSTSTNTSSRSSRSGLGSHPPLQLAPHLAYQVHNAARLPLPVRQVALRPPQVLRGQADSRGSPAPCRHSCAEGCHLSYVGAQVGYPPAHLTQRGLRLCYQGQLIWGGGGEQGSLLGG